MILYIRDFIFALWSWVTVWWDSTDCIERRWEFVNTGIDDDRKKQLPFRILIAAYRKRLNQLSKKKTK